ncbi:hypothetical protein H4R21_002226 [Coemansia helicoidea]|uniref:Uncharacterized protein n=1 Tax=Coemansia helicoidea TaxID=1286919 RepID=A0ACC1L883_9FUNG|nr:hypothetical protein H4R21_002226 [Coemansia helicoidea]
MHRRARSTGTEPAVDPVEVTSSPPPWMTNQGHDGSLSAVAQEKLDSNFSSNVLVSTRLVRTADVQTMSSYGAFIRFHNSGELNGIHITEAGLPVPEGRMSHDTREEASTFSYAASSANAPRLAPMAHSRGQDYIPVRATRASTYGSGTGPESEGYSRYSRNRDSIRRVVEDLRATRYSAERRRSDADELRRVQNSPQAGLDAARYVYEHQRREAAAAAAQQPLRRPSELQQGRDFPTQSTSSSDVIENVPATVSTVMPAGSRQPDRASAEEVCRMPPRSADGRRRETVFGMFAADGGPDTPPPATAPPAVVPPRQPAIVLDKALPPLPPRAPVDARASKAREMVKRSQSLSHTSSSNSGAGQRPISRRTRDDADLVRLAAQRAAPPLQQPPPLPPQRARTGLLSGLLSRLTGGHERRKSSGAAEPSGPGAVQRVLARRLTRRPDAASKVGPAAVVPAPTPARLPAPAAAPAAPRATDAPLPPLPVPAIEPATGHSSRMIDGIEGGSTATDTDTAELSELDAGGASGVFRGMGLAGSNVDSSRSIGCEQGPDASAIGASGGLLRAGPPAAQPSGLRHGSGGRLSESASSDDGPWAAPEAVPPAQPAAGSNGIGARGLGLGFGLGLLHGHRNDHGGGGRGRTSSVALDAITARDQRRGERPATRRSDRAPHSQPHARWRGASGATSPDDSFSDIIAAGDPDSMRDYRLRLPGLETPALSSPPTSGGRQQHRQLEEAMLFGGPGLHATSNARGTPCDSPTSDAETGRTRILGFATADVAVDRPAAVRVWPGVRPEVLDVRGIGWAESGRTQAGTAAASDSPRESFDSNEAEAARVLAELGGLPATGADLDPQALAALVQRSPDPRSLIYGAGSRFGTMRALQPPAKSPLAAAPTTADTAGNDGDPASHPAHAPAGTMAAGPAAPFEMQLPRVAATDSESLARASIQATPSASPAVAPQGLPDTAERSPAPNAAAGGSATRSDARLSLQEYIEQQRAALRSPGSGREQREFRVSLLERKPPAQGSRVRSWSLPVPRPAFPALVVSQRRQSMRTVQEPSPLVQVLLLQPPEQQPDAHNGPVRRGSGGAEAPEDTALFSNLLGDGAALTSPDVKVARRQSGVLQPGMAPAPLPFDPETDTGDNGVPESVLRAYVAGDHTAIERFFEHIMRLTTPSSVYDSDVSEDGDWAFGIEGPPPEILEQRAAAAAAAAAATAAAASAEQSLNSASREMPGMIDVSAGASCTVELGPDASHSPEPAAPVSNGRHHSEAAAATAEQPPAPHAQPPASGGEASGSVKSARRIAVPRSRLSQGGHRRRSSGAPTTPETPTAPSAGSRATPDTHHTASLSEAVGDAVAAAAALAVDVSARAGELASPAIGSQTCFSAGRGRSHNPLHRQTSDVGRRAPLPRQPRQRGPAGGEKQLLMARLRVLETIIQRTAITESRTPPPAALQHSRLATDAWSDDSPGSSAGGLDYDRIHRELRVPARAARPAAAPPAGCVRAPADRAEVLRRLRRGSQARAQVPFRAEMLGRAAIQSAPIAGPERRWPGEPASPRDATSCSDASVRVDIVDDVSSIAGSSATDIATIRQAMRLANTDRFRRTAKLLAL